MTTTEGKKAAARQMALTVRRQLAFFPAAEKCDILHLLDLELIDMFGEFHIADDDVPNPDLVEASYD